MLLNNFHLYLLLFVLGLFFGSFLNVIIYRLPRDESIVSPRSHCTECGHKLTLRELIPLLSYIFLRGRCSQCKSSISLQYPLIELMTGLLFLVNGFWAANIWVLISGFIFILLLLPLAVIDIKHKILPDKLTLTGMACGFILSFISPHISPLEAMAGVLAGGGALLLVALVSRGGMGGGDIKLMLLIGAFLGPIFALITIFLAAFLGLLAALPAIITRNLGLKSRLPFGPFLALAAYILWYFGPELISLYLRVLNF